MATRQTDKRVNKADVRVFSYLRFSTPEQSQGDSERRQIDAARKWAKRMGYTLEESRCYADKGLSGYHGHHRTKAKGGLRKFLRLVEAGEVPQGSILVVENIDRLGRENPKDVLRAVVFKLWDHGVTLQTLEPEESYPPGCEDEAKFVYLFLLIQRARNESKRKAQLISDSWGAWRARILNGEKCPPPTGLPWWLCWNPDPRVAQPDRLSKQTGKFGYNEPAAAVVRLIFKLAAEGLGVRKICMRLNADSAPVFGRVKRWEFAYVGKLLNDRTVLGDFVGKDRVYPDVFPAVITEDGWYKARNTMAENRFGGRAAGRPAQGAANLFQGLAKDASDGGTMQYVQRDERSGGNVLVSACRFKKRSERDTPTLMIPYEMFETAALKSIKELKPEDVAGETDDKADERAVLDARIRELATNITKAKARIDKAGDIDAILDLLAKWEQEAKELKARREELKAKAATDRPEDALGGAHQVLKLLKNAEGAERVELRERLRTTLRNLLERIDVLVFDLDGKPSVRCVEAQLVFKSGKVRQVAFAWLRRCKNRGTWAALANDLRLPGQELEIAGKPLAEFDLLANYRTDERTREFYAKHIEHANKSFRGLLDVAIRVKHPVYVNVATQTKAAV
jgi:DNA invertase Pin-like site-specific DNA recombinase